MKITRITVWQADLPLSHPYSLSGGRLSVSCLDSTFIRIDTDIGVFGWGEGCPWGSNYLPAHGGGIRSALSVIAPLLIGCDPRAVDEINRVMDITLPGHLSAKSPLDMACWDIAARAAGVPLWTMLGGESAVVSLNSSIPTGAPEEMTARIAQARKAGYKAHSAKIGGDDIALDIARIDAIESARHADELITFDINRAWTPAVAVQVLNSVSSRGWVEQPCETLSQCAHVAARVSQPLMLDECMHTFNDHLCAWRWGACEGVKVKPNRVGGITRARQIRDFGVAVGWQMHIEDTGGSVLADTATLHLAATTPDACRLPSWLSHAHLTTDIAPGQGARNTGGIVRLPETPGIGVLPDEEILGEPAAVYS